MARPSYLRPYGAENVQLRETPDPSQLFARLQRAAMGGPGPGRAPGVPGVLGQDPRELMQGEFTRGLGEMGRAQALAGATPRRPSVGTRVLDALEAAGSQELPTSDPYDPNFAGSAVTGFLSSFANTRAARRQMSFQQAREQERASARGATTDLRRAQAEYYRSRANAPPSGGRTGRTLAEELELEAARQRGRVDIETLREGGRDTRSQRIQDRLRRAGAGTAAGKVSPADRLIEQRYRSAVGRGETAVQSERGRRAGALLPEGRQPMSAEEEATLAGRTRHGVNPSFSADSAAVVNRINPALFGTPAPDPAREGAVRELNPILQRLLAAVAGGGRQTTEPQFEDVESGTTTVEPADVGAPNMDPDEVQGALEQIEGLDDEEAAADLEAVGFSPAEIRALLTARQ